VDAIVANPVVHETLLRVLFSVGVPHAFKAFLKAVERFQLQQFSLEHAIASVREFLNTV